MLPDDLGRSAVSTNHIPVLIICLPCLAALPSSLPSSLSLCPSFGCSAIEKFGNMKPPKYDLAAKQVKETMDKRYSPNWCCIIGLFFYFSPFSTSLAYLFRHLTYISSSFLALPSTLSKTNCFASLWTNCFFHSFSCNFLSPLCGMECIMLLNNLQAHTHRPTVSCFAHLKCV